MIGVKKYVIYWKWIKNKRKSIVIRKYIAENRLVIGRKWKIEWTFTNKKFRGWIKIIIINLKFIE